MDSNETWEYYVTTLYYSLLTMATIGYGDIVPITNGEIIFVMIVLMTACAMFAYIVGYIGSSIDKGDTLIESLRQKIIQINVFMAYHQVPRDIKF